MLETPTEEVARLRGCLNDLVGIMALPALWAGGEVHVLDAGHFALDTKADEIAVLVRAFMANAVLRNNRETAASGVSGR